MDGPALLARTLSTPTIDDQYGNRWQYHPRSDLHASIACWGLLFDLLQHCPRLAQQVEAGRVGYSVKHNMYDSGSRRRKNLDLVLCTPGDRGPIGPTFRDLASAYSLALTERERDVLEHLPELRRVDVGAVQVALEAKACMTAHVKARPRLYDELNSSHLTIHGSDDFALAVGLVLINVAPMFLSPGLNQEDLGREKPEVSRHRQPGDAELTIEKVREVPRRADTDTDGFDALGVVAIDLTNDGSAVTILEAPPAPTRADVLHYEQMIHRAAALYTAKFGES